MTWLLLLAAHLTATPAPTPAGGYQHPYYVPGPSITPVPGTGLNSNLITALVIGIPSVIIAVSTYWLAVRAKRESLRNERDRIIVGHAAETQRSWQAHIDDLQAQVHDLRAERDSLKAERDELRAERDDARGELIRTQRRVTAKRHELDDLDP